MCMFSVIVPVYNVEKYINECIYSIENQINKDFEVILVDDGSNDSSGEKCDLLAKKYNNIKVIHKKNGGLSDARNVGVKNAIGKYILFCDSDDLWIDNELLNKAIDCIKQYNEVDIILFSGKKFFEDSKEIILDNKMDCQKINESSIYDSIKYLVESGSYSMSACTKIVSRSFLTDNELYFTKGLLGEDLDWFLSIVKKAKTIKAIESHNYYYRIREGSITQTVNSKYIKDFLWILDKWIPRLRKEADRDNALLGVLAYSYMTNFLNLLKINKDEKKDLIEHYKEYKWLLAYSNNKRVSLVNKTVKIIGIIPTAKLLNIYYHKILH